MKRMQTPGMKKPVRKRRPKGSLHQIQARALKIKRGQKLVEGEPPQKEGVMNQNHHLKEGGVNPVKEKG